MFTTIQRKGISLNIRLRQNQPKLRPELLSHDYNITDIYDYCSDLKKEFNLSDVQ